jgi:hypothetical protein
VNTDWRATARTSGVGGPGGMGGMGGAPVTVNVHQVATNPMETGRFVALALRGA